jgi:hypothetical protein
MASCKPTRNKPRFCGILKLHHLRALWMKENRKISYIGKLHKPRPSEHSTRAPP